MSKAAIPALQREIAALKADRDHWREKAEARASSPVVVQYVTDPAQAETIRALQEELARCRFTSQ